MISFLDNNNSEPYKIFRNKYEEALNKNQQIIEAINIASYNITSQKVNSRFVNLKYVIDEEWIFFSNYNSKKAKEFIDHDQIFVSIYWSAINFQIRMSAKVFKTNSKFSDKHYSTRNLEKNTLAFISNQSSEVESYDKILKKYDKAIKEKHSYINKRPDYWGGFSFKPNYFEFWEGHESRINKRQYFKKDGDDWKKGYLEP